MRKLATTIAAALVILPVLLLSAPTTAAPPMQDKWTVMVYLDADNNLEPFGEMNLEMLESVGSSTDVNFVVLMDTYSGPASLLYVRKGSSDVIASWGEVNMGDPATMSAFIKEAKKAAPAEKYCFITWDHGAGWRGMNWDDTSEQQTGTSQFIDMNELRQAVEDGGVKFDVFAFDQCMMAQPEVAYEMAGYAKYLVFSEETIYGQGFPYDMIAADLEANSVMSGLELSKVIVQDFSAYYSSFNWASDWTISAYDMAAVGSLTAAVKHLASAQLNALPTYRSQFKNDLANTPGYYYPYYADLKVYATNVYNDKAIRDKDVKDAAGEGISAVHDGVVLAMNSKHNHDSTGLSIYFPSYRSSYLGLKPTYGQVSFAIDTGWLVWLQAFCANK
ncbi:MAG: hypothetical protein KJ672_01655 [Candidatus Thermoplasmatota archaeon]|nr:hypothetical protein [Candidatus Thermoplasmatota archaeon]